jgi:hypothetical protein
MAIKFYGLGDHGGGFLGWRITKYIGGRYYQKYLHFKPPSTTIPADVWQNYQSKKAEYYEARFAYRSAALKYLRFVNTDSPHTKKERRVGFHGISIVIYKGNRCHNYTCAISFNLRKEQKRFNISETKTLSAAWNDAVLHWGAHYGIRKKDIESKLASPPNPEAFKVLRRQMNAKEGHDIPASVLHWVFAEKRQDIAIKKTDRLTTKTATVSHPDIYAWFSDNAPSGNPSKT